MQLTRATPTIDLRKWMGRETHPFNIGEVTFRIPRSADGFFLLHRCSGCGGCCRPPFLKRIMLTYADMIRLSRHLGYPSVDEFRRKECLEVELKGPGDGPLTVTAVRAWCLKRSIEENAEDSVSGKSVRCRFLTADNVCKIYAVRPSSCRLWPYGYFGHRGGTLASNVDVFYCEQNDVQCQGFIEDRAMKRRLLKQPALEIKRHLREVQETIEKGLYEEKTEEIILDLSRIGLHETSPLPETR